MTPRLLSYELTIKAPAETVFDLLTDPSGLLQWIAIEAETDPRPGGQLTWTHGNGQVVTGQYLEVKRPERIVFSYRWESNDIVGPGSTRVEIDLKRLGQGSTRLHLAHHGLPAEEEASHLEGWRYFLGELARMASSQSERTAAP